MMFPSCFQQNLLILSKISKIQDGGRRRPSLNFGFVTLETAAILVMIAAMQII